MADAPAQEPVVNADSVKNPHQILVEKAHLVEEALADGVRDALLRHKERGLPVVTERDGRIIWVSAEELLAT